MNQTPLEFYKKYGTEWFSTERRQIEKMTALYKVSGLCTLMEGLRPRQILDFGCGLGDALDILAKHFQITHAIGIDISSTMIEYARREYPEYTFMHGSIEELINFQADLITFFDVLEHMEDIPAVLQIAGSNADYIAIKIPLEKTWCIDLLNRLHLKEPKSRLYESERHLYEFNRSEVETILEQVGLKILKSKTNFVPKNIHFSPYMKNRMKAKSGRLAKPKYYSYVTLSRLPYALTRPLFQVVNGVDFFVLCKS